MRVMSIRESPLLQARISKSVHNVIKYKHIANFFTTDINDLVDKLNRPFDVETFTLNKF